MRLGKLCVVLLAVCLALALAVSCGGGSDSPDGEGSGGNNTATEEAAQERGETSPGQGAETVRETGGETGQAGGSPPEIKIALGELVSVDAESRRLVLDPVEGERQAFRVVPNAQVIIDDRPTQLSDLEQGQQAQISYVTVNDRNRARGVSAFSAGGTSE